MTGTRIVTGDERERLSPTSSTMVYRCPRTPGRDAAFYLVHNPNLGWAIAYGHSYTQTVFWTSPDNGNPCNFDAPYSWSRSEEHALHWPDLPTLLATPDRRYLDSNALAGALDVLAWHDREAERACSLLLALEDPELAQHLTELRDLAIA